MKNKMLSEHVCPLCRFLLIATALFFLLCLFPLAAEEAEEFDLSKGFNLDAGRYTLSVTPKIFGDGVQTDYFFGLFYTDAMKMAGEIRFRSISRAANDEIWEIPDSLLTRDQQISELFLLPVNWYFFRKTGLSLRVGAGLYYNYVNVNEKGYFNDSTLYAPPGPDTYNAYGYDFTGHAVGPMIDAGVNYQGDFFYGSFSFGVVPIFYLAQQQTWKLSPFMKPASFTVSSESSSGPYYYLNLDLAVNLKYVTLLVTLMNEYSLLNYTGAGSDDSDGWATVDEKLETKLLAIEISILINLGLGGFKPQIGYGRTFDETKGGENYLLLGVIKQWF